MNTQKQADRKIVELDEARRRGSDMKCILREDTKETAGRQNSEGKLNELVAKGVVDPIFIV